MDRSVPRIGAWAGFIAVAGIVAYHLALIVVAGPRVSGTTDVAAIEAYYGNQAIAAIGVMQFFAVIPVLIFFVALRDMTAQTSIGRLLGTVALAAGIAEVASIVVVMSGQAAIVAAVSSGGDAVALFRLTDVLFNSGVDVLEATWVAAFGLAMREAGGFPRWMTGLSAATAILLAAKSTAIWIGIPDPATLPAAIATVIWLVGASVSLRRLAAEPRALAQPSPA